MYICWALSAWHRHASSLPVFSKALSGSCQQVWHCYTSLLPPMVCSNNVWYRIFLKRLSGFGCCRFQECTLTDVTAQDMVPPGRVMYLRRFKASPNASPIKQEEHRRRARARRVVTKPSSGLRRMTSSDSDSSGTRDPLAKFKARLSHRSTEGVASVKHNRTKLDSSGADQQGPTGTHQRSDYDREHQNLSHDYPASIHQANGDSRQWDQSPVQEQAEQDEEEEAYHRAGLQKPRKLGEGESCCLPGLLM